MSVSATAEHLGYRIRELRRARGLSQKHLAELARLSQATVAHIETGRKDPSVETLRKVTRALDIHIAGEGKVVLRFIDRDGRTLIQETLAVSGTPNVEARRAVLLSVQTAGGRVLLAPVVVRQSHPGQRVTFDGEKPADFTRKRCAEIGCTKTAASEAERGCAPPIAQGDAAVVVSDDDVLEKLIGEAARRKVGHAE